MRRPFALALAAALVSVAGAAAGDFTPTKEPLRGGARATADLPASQHKRNVGGSDGSGLCVYTSAWHAAIWQDSRDWFDFRAWMQKRPGGSYPDKFDATLKAYCAEKGIPLPGYVQHTGGDAEFVELALKTGRMVCVTYCGVDGPASYGSEVIGHMVNLVYLDRSQAAILDNNFPGRWLWMSRADFLARWRGLKPDGSAFLGRDGRGRAFPIGGGWAIVLLDSPPAPYPAERPVVTAHAGCICGDECTCKPGECPAKCPVVYGQNCANGRCGIPAAPTFVTPAIPTAPLPPAAPAAGPQPVGTAPDADHEWRQFEDGGWGWRFKAAPAATPTPPKAGARPVGGVDSERLTPRPSYSICGVPSTKADVIEAFALADDSSRWHLAAVGDAALAAKVKADVTALPADVRAKLHVQCYAPTSWQAAQFGLAPGVTLRMPAVDRVGPEVGNVGSESYTPGALRALLGAKGGPLYVAPAPVAPAPKPVPEPAPAPDAGPAPKPAAPLNLAAIAAALAALFFALNRRK
jgi:hypothetical protein